MREKVLLSSTLEILRRGRARFRSSTSGFSPRDLLTFLVLTRTSSPNWPLRLARRGRGLRERRRIHYSKPPVFSAYLEVGSTCTLPASQRLSLMARENGSSVLARLRLRSQGLEMRGMLVTFLRKASGLATRNGWSSLTLLRLLI